MEIDDVIDYVRNLLGPDKTLTLREELELRDMLKDLQRSGAGYDFPGIDWDDGYNH